MANLDARPDRLDLRDRLYIPPLRNISPVWPSPEDIKTYLPDYKSLVLDQGNEGACTGFGLAAMINYRRFQLNGYVAKGMNRTSPWMLYYMAQRYDEWEGEDYDGSSCRGAMRGWHRHGACLEELWPARKPESPNWMQDAANCPLGAYYRIERESVRDMQAAIFDCQAIFVSASTHSGWNEIRTGEEELPVIPLREKKEGGHAFALVGYIKTGFILQNSWGEDWGYHGFAVITYQDWVENGMDAWVAVLGAPVEIGPLREKELRGFQFERPESFAARRKDLGEKYPYQNEAARPWPKFRAELHTLVLGNDGEILNRLAPDLAIDGKEAVETVAYKCPKTWLQDQEKKKLAIYAHGGLNSEEDAFKRVRVLGPYFLENGIYPIFINWRTGVGEVIKNLISQALPFGKEAGFSRGMLDGFIELLGKKLGRPVWREMKSNAELAAEEEEGGTFALARQLARLKADFPSLEIHHLGHSAGAILLGHFLGALAEFELKSNSMNLFAAACTVDFALEHLKGAVESGQLPAERLTFHNLTDELERRDDAGPYGRSLLYLISRALEKKDTPIVGMETVWTGEVGQWRKGARDEVQAWKEWVAGKGLLTIHGELQIDVSGRKKADQKHGTFDNHMSLITSCIQEIRGEALSLPIESLEEF